MSNDVLAAALKVLRSYGVTRFEGLGIKVEFGRMPSEQSDEPKPAPETAPRMSAEERLAAFTNPLMRTDANE